MVAKRQCSFCAGEIEPGRGVMFVKRDGSVFYFCSGTCRKHQLTYHRVGHQWKWTRAHALKVEQAKGTHVAAAKPGAKPGAKPAAPAATKPKVVVPAKPAAPKGSSAPATKPAAPKPSAAPATVNKTAPAAAPAAAAAKPAAPKPAPVAKKPTPAAEPKKDEKPAA
ncbi:MAG: hypothetical protein KGJ23_03185 [Euryarchaeota archaeon]|nr:hypothetical protein [Euryarchaeota archaeon]MDE1835602.1 hypothetical protein [Euryarchaeota archaeon]MDE1878950.1 hypothetical protein [Euryarchaeota archaeon]MDE2043776.1 hypothetical protein [Thermoplasmata archaeon]